MYYGDEGKKIIEHVLRPPIPWRRGVPLTECGLSVQGSNVLTREDFLRKVRDQGIQRAMLSTCYTCGETAQRHPDWHANPAGCLSREISSYARSDRRDQINRELRALAVLSERYRAEFEELMQDQREIVPLSSARRRRPRKV